MNDAITVEVGPALPPEYLERARRSVGAMAVLYRVFGDHERADIFEAAYHGAERSAGGADE